MCAHVRMHPHICTTTLKRMHTCMHMHTCLCTHTHTHMCLHVRTHTYVGCTCTREHAHPQAHVYMCVYTRTPTHACVCTHVQYTHMRTHACMHSYCTACTREHAHADTRACAYARMHIRTCMHNARVHTHACARTHTPAHPRAGPGRPAGRAGTYRADVFLRSTGATTDADP